MAKNSNKTNVDKPIFNFETPVVERNWRTTFGKKINERDIRVSLLSSLFTLGMVFILALNGVDFNLGRSDATKVSSNSVTSVVPPAQSGQVALTEEQLRAEISKIGTEVFWVGPLKGAKYSLINQSGGRIFITYLPDGNLNQNGKSNNVVIATYAIKDAFAATKEVGSNSSKSLKFTNDDGAIVYYDTNRPTNVYLAYPNKDFQIEIYDPTKGAALNLATSKGKVRVIK